MKAIEQLEQEAISKAIMQLSCVAKEITLHMQTFSRNLIEVSEQMRQLQAVSMCISSNEVSGDGSGESLPKYIEKKGLSNIAASQDYLTGDGSGKSLPEVSQEERLCDGWIEWGGGDCPVNQYDRVDYKLRNGFIDFKARADLIQWRRDIVERPWDIVAYKIVKGE